MPSNTPREHSIRSDVPEILEIHCEENDQGGTELRLTFAVDIQPEGLAAALYMDGSLSMRNFGNYGSSGGGLLARFGRQTPNPNPVQDAMRAIVPYVAGLDANGSCRVAYWATGSGQDIEVIGELDADRGATTDFPGPRVFGNGTYLLPAVRDFVAYIQQQVASGEKVERAFAIIVTDGELHDLQQVIQYTRTQLSSAIQDGKFPLTDITVVGVGSQVDEEQLEELEHEATPKGQNEIFHFAMADQIDQLPQLVAHLVDASRPAFYGGATVLDDRGNVLATYEDMVPAVLEINTTTEIEKVVLRTPNGDLHIDLPEEEH